MKEADYTGFIECDECAAKPGAPTLCADCLVRRATMSEAHRAKTGGFIPALYPLKGTHVEPGDADRDSLMRHASLAQDNVGRMLVEAIRVRDQHRGQVDALRAEVHRLNALCLPQPPPMVFTKDEAAWIVAALVRERSQQFVAHQSTDVLDSAIAKIKTLTDPSDK